MLENLRHRRNWRKAMKHRKMLRDLQSVLDKNSPNAYSDMMAEGFMYHTSRGKLDWRVLIIAERLAWEYDDARNARNARAQAEEYGVILTDDRVLRYCKAGSEGERLNNFSG